MPPASTSAEALQNLQGFQGQMKSGSDLLSAQEQKLGIPQAQQQVSGLRQAITNTTNLLNQIPSSVYGRAAGSLVTSGQAGRQIQNESAPVSSKLQSQNQDYGQQESDLQQLTGKAQTGAQLDLSDQQSKLGVLQNIYQALFGQEQASQAQALEQQKLQEQMREANMSAKAAGGGGIDLGSLLGGGGSAAATPSIAQRTGGGFNFNDSGGKAISAAKYAQLTNTPLGTLLKQMAQSGDRYAANAYAAIANHPNLTPQALTNIKKNYSAIYWGT
jgi:hypothetical protein